MSGIHRAWMAWMAIAVCAAMNPGHSASDAGIPAEISLTPGQIAVLRYKLPAGTVPSALRCGGKDVQYFIGEDGYLNAFISEPCGSRHVPYACRLQTSKGERVAAKVAIEKKDFPRAFLKVDPSKVTLSKKDAARAARERKIIAAVYQEGSAATPYFDQPFIFPVEAKVGSPYGVRRIFNKQQKSQHLGVDFAAGEGTPVQSSNRGKVVFTGDLFYAGNTVIIDHGVGVYTIYAHLSKIDVKRSDVVEKGEVIGFSGKTGRVTGPHVHWGVRVMGELCDGQSLVRAYSSTGLKMEGQ
ncbi:MAG: M23 family metallopeptidase [Deltaproteobacteria bacterium]|nr:M23 family metallopeptidase [Deltaproteobacteria bacterium]